jgi:hypothetical protein
VVDLHLGFLVQYLPMVLLLGIIVNKMGGWWLLALFFEGALS